ncbi:MAG: hypothetical protein KI792_05000 [Alphaproteobacteria bacterium]|nr:hypothetical protein [Alphaproteobacteria bacterium SS10]
MVANTPAARSVEPTAERRPDPRQRRRLSGPARALMASLATAPVAVAGAASAHEAAFQEFTSGNRAAVHLVQAGPNDAAPQATAPARAADRGFACITVASETAPRGAILFAAPQGAQMALVPTEAPGTHPTGPAQLDCGPIEAFEAQVRTNTEAFVADVAAFIRETSDQLNMPQLQQLADHLESDGFTASLPSAHQNTATAFNLTMDAARGVYGEDVDSHISPERTGALIREYQKVGVENQILAGASGLVNRVQRQLDAASAPAPQGDAPVEGQDINFDPGSIQEWRGRNVRPVNDGPERGMKI